MPIVEVPAPKGMKLITCYGISDRGEPTEWFPSREERDAEGRRRFDQFFNEETARLKAERGISDTDLNGIVAVHKEARAYAASHVIGRKVENMAEPPPDENGKPRALHTMLNEQRDQDLRMRKQQQQPQQQASGEQ